MALRQQLAEASRQVLVRLAQRNERMLSWDHCYNYFHGLPKAPTKAQIDHAALHLAFYLASYGMYRGSAVLLGKDYKFLIPVILTLRSKEFVTRKQINSIAEATTPERAMQVWGQLRELEGCLRGIGINQGSLGTLSTKIMLGTWVTVPAFDTSLKKALKESGIGKATYSRQNHFSVFSFINGNASTFQRQVDRFHAAGLPHYPAMRVVDALLWHLGGGDDARS
jgi:hypothetical protein